MTKPQTTNKELDTLTAILACEPNDLAANDMPEKILRKLLHDCREYHRLVREDDDVEIGEAWLQSIGFVPATNNYWTWIKGEVMVLSYSRTNVWTITVDDDDDEGHVSIPEPTTRGQLRRLAAALGIELKESV